MPKVFVGLLFVVALSAQVTTIPAAAGGGGGTIAAGRVAFGDGSSTAATDANFLWDNTNKRFQLGDFTAWPGYEPYVKFSNITTDTRPFAAYQDLYANILQYTYGNNTTGASGADVYGLYTESSIVGNSDLTAAGGGPNGIVSAVYGRDTAKLAYATGISSSVLLADSSTSNSVKALSGVISILPGASTLYAYGVQVVTSGSGTSESWALAVDTPWPNRLQGKTVIGENNSTTPSSTLYVKDSTATTGSTSVQFDVGAGQSSTSTILTLGGVIRFNGQNTTGAGSASLGANSPAVTNTAPYTWIRIVTADGSTAYIPAWK